jgi:hypothetical protein
MASIASNRRTQYHLFEKLIGSMRTTFNGSSENEMKGGGGRWKIARLLWPRFVELWIFAAIATFFLVRVLGSHTWESILARMAHRNLP